MTVAPPPADEQAAADELDNLLQHLQNSGFSLAAGWSDTKDAIAAKTRIKTAVAAYSRTQTEAAIIKELKFLDTCPPALIYVGIADRIKHYGGEPDAVSARLRGEAK